MRYAFVAAIAVVCSARPTVADPVTLAKPEWKAIVCHADAIPSERYAAREFQRLFEAATGRALPIVERAQTPAIYVGPDAVAASGRTKPMRDAGEEDLRISISRDAICIDGGRPRGALYGVYELFEEMVGARFLTVDHTYIPPEAASRPLPIGTREYRPPFAFRWSYYGETGRRPDFAARLRTNTVGADPTYGGRTGYRLVMHNVANLVPPAKYGKEHPDYFALVNGERRMGAEGGGPQLCLTHPDLLDIVTQAVLDEARKDPDARNISIAQMDNNNYCTCPRCAALDAREGSQSGTLLSFVNAVAERIEKVRPDLLISTYAYAYTRKPPRTIRARHNVLIQLCSIECCQFHAIDDRSCALNREFCRDMAAWKPKCDQMLVWHYNTNFAGYMLPFPNLRSIGRSVAYFQRNGGRGVFMQAAGNGFSSEMSDLRNYVMSRCLWKPGRDSWAEAREFCRLHYAEASAPILRYLGSYHDLVGKAGLHPHCFATESAVHVDGTTARMAVARFAEAMALARSDEVRHRVEKASLCAHRAALSAASTRWRLDDGILRPDLAGFAPDLLDRYAELCTRYGATMETEHATTGSHIEGLRSLFAGLRAAVIENATWRVAVIPESNGKVVEMLHKPTGRNVIMPHRAFNRFRYEDWVRDGEGPGARSIMAYEVAEARPDRLTMRLTTPDGTRFERVVALDGDAVRIEGAVTVREARALDLWLHPEYDAATTSSDPNVVGIYVRVPDWVHVNRLWKDAQPTAPQSDAVTNAAPGGAFAMFNHTERFGVEQRFDPDQIGRLGLYWYPSRLQVNLELIPNAVIVGAGQTTRFWYEVRYLSSPPTIRRPLSSTVKSLSERPPP